MWQQIVYKEPWLELRFKLQSLCCWRSSSLKCYSEPAGKLVEELLCAKLSIEPDKDPSRVSSGYVSRVASASARALKTKKKLNTFFRNCWLALKGNILPETHAGRFNIKSLQLPLMFLAQQSYPLWSLLAELLKLSLHLKKNFFVIHSRILLFISMNSLYCGVMRGER